jgi:tetratricopeptide (TPR) repeat protein
MNALAVIDRQGEVTNVACEAQVALQTGDTARSAQLFKQAGEMLESAVARLGKASERDLARFLAATHYYKGGAYREAARVCSRTQEGRLPTQVRHLYAPFLKDVRTRSAPDYFARYEQILKGNYQHAKAQNDPAAAQKVIDILKDHPYIIRHPFMAYVRARCCEILGKRRAATLFFRNAWRFNPHHPLYWLAYLDSLCKEGKHAEAWAIVEERLEKQPGALSSIYAMSVVNAILERDRVANPPTDEHIRQQRRDELLKHFDSALEACQSMTYGERKAIAPQIDYAFLIAWDPYREMNGHAKLIEMIDRWIELCPDSPRPRELRGMVAYPSETSDRDFRDAVRLGSDDPLPYYFLAHDALLLRHFRECALLCSQALQRQPESEVRATLLFWQAISCWNLGRDKADIRKLFDEARKLKPDDSLIASFARTFEENGRASDPPAQITIEDDPHWREQAERYVNQTSMQRIHVNQFSLQRFEEESPVLDASLV